LPMYGRSSGEQVHVRLQDELGVVSHVVLHGDQHLFVPLSVGRQFELARTRPDRI
jgi:hypothetical protein